VRRSTREAPLPAGVRPTPAQTLLLQAALLPDARAIEAWDRWRAGRDLRTADLEGDAAGLLPLVAPRLRRLGAHEPAMAILNGLSRYWWCANQDAFHHTAALLKSLQADGIDTLVLGGVAASLLHYRDASVPPIDRIRVLIPIGRVPAALDALRVRGWRDTGTWTSAALRYRIATRLSDGQAHELDLHWRALREGAGAEPDRGFWRRSVPLVVHAVETRGPAPGDALLDAVMRARRSGVAWVADAMAILAAAERHIDWEALIEEAAARRIGLHVGGALGYLTDTFGAPVPAEVRPRLVSTPSWIERLELHGLAEPSPPRRSPRAAQRAVRVAADYWRAVAGDGTLAKTGALPGFLRDRWRRGRRPVERRERGERVPEAPRPKTGDGGAPGG